MTDEQRHVAALERREDWLAQRIAQADADGRVLHWDAAERTALAWLLRKVVE